MLKIKSNSPLIPEISQGDELKHHAQLLLESKSII